MASFRDLRLQLLRRTDNPSGRKVRESLHICPTCRETFKTDEAYKLHYRIQHGENQF